MRKIILLALLVSLSGISSSQNKIEINEWLKSGVIKVHKPAFNTVEDIDGKTFSNADKLKKFKPNLTGLLPEDGLTTRIFNKDFKWSKTTVKNDSVIANDIDSSSFVFLAAYINADRWTKASINITTDALLEVYIDDKLESSKTNSKMNSVKSDVSLNSGKHLLILKFLGNNKDVKLHVEISFDKAYDGNSITLSLNPKRFMTIDDILNGTKISSAKLSPSGEFLLINFKEIVDGKTKSYSVLKNLISKQNVTVFRNQKLNQIKWLPRTDRLSYTVAFDKSADLYVYDIKTSEETLIVSGLKDLSNYQWSPTEEFVIYSENIKNKEQVDLKRIFGNDDRLPYFRNRSFLHIIDVNSGSINQLTSGNLSTYLHDIHPSGTKALISTQRRDYTEVPFSKQNLYELNLNTSEMSVVWENKRYAGYAQYSPDGKTLLIQGGPECFGDIGKNVSSDKIPNAYDGQLYLYNLKSKKADPISLNFDPAIDNAFWSKSNDIYIKVDEKDYNSLYKYDLSSNKFIKITLETDVLSRIDYSYLKPFAVYNGTSISTPDKLFFLDLSNGESTEIIFPEKEIFKSIEFGNNEDWNFVNKNNTTIYGRIYYPPDFDKSKKYPVIVYYYGGTSPITRDFGGRYPKNIWAANGYIVYVLQPAGATGFGQEFSALHVNGWGFDAIDDIIDGTKEFLKTHPNADPENVGCMGASYGGYTTMLLQTRTDIFKTAVSHAGISSITSYWGEGYWGYSYSATATAYSYPWNRKDIYVENSPLYNADKFNNSILLLHGTDDTNVPVGESLQYYAALKILGKDVEMVLVDGENHWIIDYEKRKKWHRTIISWFDKKLKGQAQEWENMYPDKNF